MTWINKEKLVKEIYDNGYQFPDILKLIDSTPNLNVVQCKDCKFFKHQTDNCWTHNCDGCMYEPTEGVQ